jgi:riboflavin synthase
MFTGIIEEIGKLALIENIPGGRKIKIYASKIMDDVKIDDSICVNGVCLTVTKFEKDHFFVDAVGATLNKTTISNLKMGTELNLERAVKLSDRLGGHLVQGHANGTGRVTRLTKLGENYFLEITIPDELEKYVIQEGSIAVDGISLTVALLNGNKAGLSIIPHTWNSTNLKFRKTGDDVNIEVDVIAKYAEKLLNGRKDNGKITEKWLKDIGY